MRRISSIIVVLLLCLVPSAAASANFLQVMALDYASDGTLNACKYTQKQLNTVKSLLNNANDIEQYAPDFPAALDDAIARRAQGACSAKQTAAPLVIPTGPGKRGPGRPITKPGVQQPAPTPPAVSSPAPAVANDPAIARAALTTTRRRQHDAVPLVALAIVGGLLALGALIFGMARWWAWEPRWALSARHATAEAGWRASSAWAEFGDFVRFGR